jgi:hypothetical protein
VSELSSPFRSWNGVDGHEFYEGVLLRALDDKKEPRREGKRVIFDEELSIATISSNGGQGFVAPN